MPAKNRFALLTAIALLLMFNLPSTFAGTLPTGSVCRSSALCQSNFCQIKIGAASGTCQTAPSVSATSKTTTTQTAASKDAAIPPASAFDQSSGKRSIDEIARTFSKSAMTDVKSAIQDAGKVAAAEEAKALISESENCPAPDASKLITKTTIYVPKDISTIQGAIDAAYSGAVIIVDSSKTFQENIDISGKYVLIMSSSQKEKAPIRAEDLSKPNILIRCNGGAKFTGLDIEGGAVGIKALSKNNKNSFIVVDSYIGNVGTGIVSNQAAINVSQTTFEGINDSGIVATGANAEIEDNKFGKIGKEAIYVKGSMGFNIRHNTFKGPIGEGAIFIEGGAALVWKNDFSLNKKAFGMILTHNPANKSKTIFEVVDNIINDSLGTAITVIGNGTGLTNAHIEANTIHGFPLDKNTGSPSLNWLASKDKEAALFGVGGILDTYSGILLVNLSADTRVNNVQEVERGLMFAHVCGIYQGNVSTKNGYGMVTMSSPEGCILGEPVKDYTEKLYCDCLIPGVSLPNGVFPTPQQLAKYKPICNLIYGNTLQNHASDKGLSVPKPPEPVGQ